MPKKNIFEGISLHDLALDIGTNSKTLRNYILGKMPKEETRIKIEKYFKERNIKRKQ